MDQESLDQLQKLIPQIPEWKRDAAIKLLADPAAITAEQVLRLREASDYPPLHEMRANENVAYVAEMAWRAVHLTSTNPEPQADQTASGPSYVSAIVVENDALVMLRDDQQTVRLIIDASSDGKGASLSRDQAVHLHRELGRWIEKSSDAQDELTDAITALVTHAVARGLSDTQIVAALNHNLQPFATVEDRDDN